MHRRDGGYEPPRGLSLTAMILVGAPRVELGFDRYERPVLAVERYARNWSDQWDIEPIICALATRCSTFELWPRIGGPARYRPEITTLQESSAAFDTSPMNYKIRSLRPTLRFCGRGFCRPTVPRGHTANKNPASDLWRGLVIFLHLIASILPGDQPLPSTRLPICDENCPAIDTRLAMPRGRF